MEREAVGGDPKPGTDTQVAVAWGWRSEGRDLEVEVARALGVVFLEGRNGSAIARAVGPLPFQYPGQDRAFGHPASEDGDALRLLDHVRLARPGWVVALEGDSNGWTCVVVRRSGRPGRLEAHKLAQVGPGPRPREVVLPAVAEALRLEAQEVNGER